MVKLRKAFRWVKAFQGGKHSLKDSNHPSRQVVAARKKNIVSVRHMVEDG